MDLSEDGENMKRGSLFVAGLVGFSLIFFSSAGAGPKFMGDASSPTGGNFGLGVLLGDPSGASAKWYLEKVHAIDFAIAYGFQGDGTAQFHADYLFHPHVLVEANDLRVPWFVGVGTAANLKGGYFELGIRFPVGISYLLKSAPVDIVLEFAPGFTFRDPGFRADVAVGSRYYF